MTKFAIIRTKNHSAHPLRKTIVTDQSAIVRLGSLTPTEYCSRKPREIIEINTVEAIQNSRNKLLMKSCFKKHDVSQALWWTLDEDLLWRDLPFPVVIKRVFGFKGRGMKLLFNNNELEDWLNTQPSESEWFVEKFYNYSREYRLHVSNVSGVFLSWRKLRVKETQDRWFFNSINSNWVGENHELFNRPVCWDNMCEEAVKALHSTGLDIGAVDIRVQAKEENPHFIVCEINSAPALGNIGIEKYKEEITNLINNKTNGKI
jgi:glutathione synthase/RimK-type ligase-like ATP-grasp enzyme